MEKIEFSEFLRKERERRGLGINQLARLTGLNPATISKLENKKRKNPDLRVIKKLSNALEIPLLTLLEIAYPFLFEEKKGL